MITMSKQKRFVRLCFFIYLAALWRVKIKERKTEVAVCNFLFHNCL